MAASGDSGEPTTSPDYGIAMWSWCVRETAHWLSGELDHDAMLEEFDRLNDTISELSCYEIRNGSVSVRPRPQHLSVGNHDRETMYRDFLGETVRLFCPSLSADLAIYYGDSGFDSAVPVFSFQKRRGQTCILLPDVDLIRDNFFYPHRDFHDGFRYGDKMDIAVFAGSTSGHHVTLQSIAALSHPRIRAAVNFKGSDHVHFRLPSIVQYDNEETKKHLQALGLGSESIPWQAQLRNKFVISMDGNGATCSRMAVTLASNSALLKYDSDSILYYFDGLKPWLHYIPIASDEQVVRVVKIERAQPGRLGYIAREGRIFAQTYLTRYRAMRYTAWLLELYASIRARGGGAKTPKPPHDDTTLCAEARYGGVMAHLYGKGNTWFAADSLVGEVGSGHYIEGFYVEPGVALGLHELSYRIVRRDGTLSAPCNGGVYCGTIGASEPIFGFQINLHGQAQARFGIFYTGYFSDGIAIGPMEAGAVCRSGDARPLEAMRVQFRSRSQ